MTTPILKQSILVIAASTLFAAALWGCGGAGTEGAGGGGGAGARGLSFAVQWPDDTRLVPNNATKVGLQIRFVGSTADGAENAVSSDAPGVAAACADGNCTVTINKSAESAVGTLSVGSVPLGSYTMKAEAKNSTDQILASNASTDRPAGDGVAVVEGVGSQSITLVMGAAAKTFDVRFRTVTGDAAGSWSAAANLSPVGATPDIAFDSVEGGLIEVEASAKNAAANVLNLRFQGAAPGVEELTINLNGSPLKLDQLAVGATSPTVIGIGTLPANQAINNIEVVYKDGGGLATAETTAVAKARLIGAKSFQPLAGAGSLVPGPAGSSRFDDLDFDGTLGGGGVSRLRILCRPTVVGTEDRGSLLAHDGASFITTVLGSGTYTPAGVGTRNGRLATFASGNNVTAVGVNAGGFFTRAFFGANAFVDTPGTDLFEAAGSPSRSGVILAATATGALSSAGTVNGLPASLPTPFSDLAAAFEAKQTPVLLDNTNLTSLALFTAQGTSIKKYRAGVEVAGAIPAQPANVVDIAGRDGFLFVLLENMTLRVYSSEGALVGEALLSDLVEPKALAVGKRLAAGYPVAVIDKNLIADPEANGFRRFTWSVN